MVPRSLVVMPLTVKSGMFALNGGKRFCASPCRSVRQGILKHYLPVVDVIYWYREDSYMEFAGNSGYVEQRHDC